MACIFDVALSGATGDYTELGKSILNGRDISDPHNIDNLEPLTPWQHAKKDPFRHYTGPKPEGY